MAHIVDDGVEHEVVLHVVARVEMEPSFEALADVLGVFGFPARRRGAFGGGRREKEREIGVALPVGLAEER